MKRIDEFEPRSSRVGWSRSLLAKAGAIYLVLACLGLGVLLEFVPGLFDLDQLSLPRLLVIVALVIFVVAPVVAVGYVIVNIAVEGFFVGVGWVIKSCFRAVARFFKQLLRGAKE